MIFDKFTDPHYCPQCLIAERKAVRINLVTNEEKVSYVCGECEVTFEPSVTLTRIDLYDIIFSFVLAPLDEEILKHAITAKLESKQNK